MDKIMVKDLLIRGIVGINDWEREKEQDILINMVFYQDLTAAGKSDNIEDTLNYRTITKDVITYVKQSDHYLVETLAFEILKIAIKHYNVQKATVRVEKPGALRFSDSVGVEMTRTSEDID